MNDLFTLFTSRFAIAGIDAVVTGSVAAMFYGEPRLTHDIDLVVLLDADSIPALVDAFPEEEFYCAPEEVIRVEAGRAPREVAPSMSRTSAEFCGSKAARSTWR